MGGLGVKNEFFLAALLTGGLKTDWVGGKLNENEHFAFSMAPLLEVGGRSEMVGNEWFEGGALPSSPLLKS